MAVKQWKSIKDYEFIYEISNHGEVKSLKRTWVGANGGIHSKPTTILKGGLDTDGYKLVVLHKDGIKETATIHRLVWDHFGDKPRKGLKLQVYHKDHNRLNNYIGNLGLLNNRDIRIRGFLNKPTTSKYPGVCWNKSHNKWSSSIRVNGKYISLGSFIYEKAAGNAYQRALSKLNRFESHLIKSKKKKRNKHGRYTM